MKSTIPTDSRSVTCQSEAVHDADLLGHVGCSSPQSAVVSLQIASCRATIGLSEEIPHHFKRGILQGEPHQAGSHVVDTISSDVESELALHVKLAHTIGANLVPNNPGAL